MAKITRKLEIEAGWISFNDILSFRTENYIGIWDFIGEEFFVFLASNSEFNKVVLPPCKTLEELDDAVHKVTGDHITDVYDGSRYEFNLMET